TFLKIDNNFLQFFLVSSIVGLFLEFTIGLVYYLVFNARLYRYYRHNILGFTSWDTLPLWSGAAMLFFAIWKSLNLGKPNLVGFNFIITFIGYGFLTSFVILGFVAFLSYREHKRLKLSKFQEWKAIVFSFFSIGGTLGILA